MCEVLRTHVTHGFFRNVVEMGLLFTFKLSVSFAWKDGVRPRNTRVRLPCASPETRLLTIASQMSKHAEYQLVNDERESDFMIFSDINFVCPVFVTLSICFLSLSYLSTYFVMFPVCKYGFSSYQIFIA
jgi:hypothetical protein